MVVIFHWNVYCPPGTAGDEHARKAAAHVQAVLHRERRRKRDIDILCFNEMFQRNMRQEMLTMLSNDQERWIHLKTPYTRKHAEDDQNSETADVPTRSAANPLVSSGLLVCWRASQVERNKSKRVKCVLFKNCSQLDCLSYKSGVLLPFIVKKSGKELNVVATHLQSLDLSFNANVRCKQRAQIKSLLNGVASYVVVGDMNESPCDEHVAQLAGTGAMLVDCANRSNTYGSKRYDYAVTDMQGCISQTVSQGPSDHRGLLVLVRAVV
jgi:endonuclease/exonuclease/phosphatase family metal-dependent hydrolase